MGWLAYLAAVLLLSGAIGWHLGRFRAAYTEMTGMMAGMTMGMLNGFLLGFAAAAFARSMFWGNLVGILLGLLLGIYFGRAGGLMGIMDGGLGGFMGGSMGAMLAIMVSFPDWAELATAALLGAIYLVGMAGLVVLIERSAPGHAALHRLAPFFTRAIAAEIAEEQAARPACAPLPSRPHRAGPPAPPGQQARQPAPPARRRAWPLPWLVLGLVGVSLLGLLGLYLATQPAAAPGRDTSNDQFLPAYAQGVSLPADVATRYQAQAAIAPLGADGKQTLDVVINGTTMSYSPHVIQVRQGRPVRFNLSIEGADPG